MAFALRIVAGICDLSAALDQDVSLTIVSTCSSAHGNGQSTYLECVFSREALVTMCAGEGLNCQMNSLMTLEIMIPVEALWALVALERSVVRSLLLVLRMA